MRWTIVSALMLVMAFLQPAAAATNEVAAGAEQFIASGPIRLRPAASKTGTISCNESPIPPSAVGNCGPHKPASFAL